MHPYAALVNKRDDAPQGVRAKKCNCLRPLSGWNWPGFGVAEKV